MEYLFSPAVRGDAEAVFSLIRQRIRWMDEVGIEQWNKEDYWKAFPPAHFYAAIEGKRLFVLTEQDSGQIVGAGVLAAHDDGWPKDDILSFYLHNFVTALDAPGVGNLFLQRCEQYARENGASVLRLDCEQSNRKLNQYYERHGYLAVGTLIDGPFTGTRREKRLG